MANSLKNTVNELIRIFLLVPLGNIIATSLRVTQLGDIVGNLLVTTTSTSLVLTNSVNIAMGTSTGSQIGTATTQLIGFHGATPVDQAAAIAALTDNSAGSANDTIQALPDPTDTPVTADDLREDLVAVFIPALRNNIADLTAKVNAITAALREKGLIAT